MLAHGDKKLLWLLCGSQMVSVRKCHYLKGTAMSRYVCVQVGISIHIKNKIFHYQIRKILAFAYFPRRHCEIMKLAMSNLEPELAAALLKPTFH